MDDIKNIQGHIDEPQRKIDESYQSRRRLCEDLAALRRSLDATMIVVSDITGTDEWKRLQAIFPDITEDCFYDAVVIYGAERDPEGTPSASTYLDLFNNLTSILPYIPKTLEAYKKESGLEEITFLQFMENKDPATGKPAESLFNKCQKQITNVFPPAYTPASLAYPTDKVNGTIWNELSSSKRKEDGFFHIAVERRGAAKISILYNIDFEKKEEKLKEIEDKYNIPRLTPYTKRVVIAANELYFQTDIFSITQLYHAMGYKGQPNENVRQRLIQEINLLMCSKITIDNSQEVGAGYNYPMFRYTGSAMPCEYIENYGYINGALVKDAIHLLRKPPLMDFAESRNQFTKIPIEALQTSLRAGSANLEDYILQRVAKMKHNPKESRKILYKTVYQKCGATDKFKRQRTRANMKKILDNYVKCNFISGYEESKKKDGINIKIIKRNQ